MDEELFVHLYIELRKIHNYDHSKALEEAKEVFLAMEEMDHDENFVNSDTVIVKV